jgi:hypothetical protein
MKRILSILMLPIYLLATGGMATAKHNCALAMGQKAAAGSDDCCCSDSSCSVVTQECGACCSDDINYLKLSTDQERVCKDALHKQDTCADIDLLIKEQSHLLVCHSNGTSNSNLTALQRATIKHRWPTPTLYLQFCSLKIGDVDCSV